MPMWLARTILAVTTIGGISWTVYARLHPNWGEIWTTSLLLHYAQKHCDQIATILILLVDGLLEDSLPGVSHWFIRLFIVSLYALGHGLWPIPPGW